MLAPHGIFNDGTLNHWDDYLLGNFTLTDSPIADFDGVNSFPSLFPDHGQVNVYAVHITGWGRVHFDAYNASTFAPFGHDAEFNTVFLGTAERSWSAIKALFR